MGKGKSAGQFAWRKNRIQLRSVADTLALDIRLIWLIRQGTSADRSSRSTTSSMQSLPIVSRTVVVIGFNALHLFFIFPAIALLQQIRIFVAQQDRQYHTRTGSCRDSERSKEKEALLVYWSGCKIYAVIETGFTPPGTWLFRLDDGACSVE